MTPATCIMDNQARIFIFCDGGFANRVNSLMSGMVLAQLLGLKFLVLWPRNNRCGATFDELFTSDLPHETWRLQDLIPYEKQLRLWLHENDVGFTEPVTSLRQISSISELRTLFGSDNRSILFCENACLSWLPEDLLNKALNNLSFTSAITERAKRILLSHADGHFVGIHLRGTDFGAPPPVDQMLSLVSTRLETMFFVCSDDPALEERFAQYPNVFLHHKSAYVNKLSEGGWRTDVLDSDGLPYSSNIDRTAQSVIEACVDLLLLAASEIYPTSLSSFLTLSARLRSSGFLDRHIAKSNDESASSKLVTMNLEAETPSNSFGTASVESEFTSQNEVLGLLNLIRPVHVASDYKVRIGSEADGGYVMPSCSLKSNLLISIGVGGETSFDVALASGGANVLQFDHTIEQTPVQHPNIHFYRRGWAPKDEGDLVSLQTMMSLANWQTESHAILKFDTEGAEWNALAACKSSDLARFEVITGEFHNLHNVMHRDFFNGVKLVWEKLTLTHQPIHIHPNNATGIVLVLGIPIPPLLEITFMRKSSATFGGHSIEPIPGPLDRPNMADRPDLCLRPF